MPSPKRKRKSKAKKKAVKQMPAIFYSENPVSLKEWQEGKSSPSPRATQPK